MADSLLEVGYVARAHGLKGEIVVKTFDPSSTALSEVDRLVLRTRGSEWKPFGIARLGEAPGGDLLVALDEVTQRSQADSLKGATVHVYREDLSTPQAGEYFQGDLVGLRAVTPDGSPLGVVEEMWNTGPVPNLCIRDGRSELLVPFAEEFVPRVDLATKTIVIVPPQYEEE